MGDKQVQAHGQNNSRKGIAAKYGKVSVDMATTVLCLKQMYLFKHVTKAMRSQQLPRWFTAVSVLVFIFLVAAVVTGAVGISIAVENTTRIYPRPTFTSNYHPSLAIVSSHTSSYHPGTKSLAIVSSHFNEDLNWLKQSPWPVKVYTHAGGTKPAISATKVLKNVGSEASAYLAYIVDNYDNLPDRVAFIHGHEHAWHHRKGHIFTQLHNIQTNDEFNNKQYITLNGRYLRTHGARGKALHKVWDNFKDHFGSEPPKIHKIKGNATCHDCCAQFVVTKERIRAVPLAQWKKWLEFSQTPSSHRVGYVFESMWHRIFGEEDMTSAPCAIKK